MKLIKGKKPTVHMLDGIHMCRSLHSIAIKLCTTTKESKDITDPQQKGPVLFPSIIYAYHL